MDIKAVRRRLRTVEGQLSGIIKMIEGDKSCEEILIQLSSAKAALHKTGQIVLESYLLHCVSEAVRNGNEEETKAKFSSAIEQFSRFE